jgi:hypothetical protein
VSPASSLVILEIFFWAVMIISLENDYLMICNTLESE